MRPRFHPAAIEEIMWAIKVGEERGAGLGRELLLGVRRVVHLLCETPMIGEPEFRWLFASATAYFGFYRLCPTRWQRPA